MSTGPYCQRCKTNVRLEQDGQSCSNCGAKLVTPIAPSRQEPRRNATKARKAHNLETAGSTPASATTTTKEP